MKRELLFVFLLLNFVMPFSVFCSQAQTISLEQQLFLDLDDEMLSEDEEAMFEAVDQTPKEPSLLWSWVCRAGSTVVVNYIYAKRYVTRVMNRIQLFWRYHTARNQGK